MILLLVWHISCPLTDGRIAAYRSTSLTVRVTKKSTIDKIQRA